MRRKFLSTTYNAVSELYSHEIVSKAPTFLHKHKTGWSIFKLKIMDFPYTPYKVAYDTNFYPTSARYYSILASANSRKQKCLEIETGIEEIVGEDTDKHLKTEGNESDINPKTTTSKQHVNKDSKNTKSQTANSDSNKKTDSGDSSTGDNKEGNSFFQLLFNFSSVASAVASVIAIYMAKQALEYETKKDVEKAIEDIESDLSKLVVKVGTFNREDMCKLGQILDRINGNGDIKAYFNLQEKSSGAFVHMDTISNLLYCTNKWASQYMVNHNGRGTEHVRTQIKNIAEIFFGFLHNYGDLSFTIDTKFNGMTQNKKYVYILEKLNHEKPFELMGLYEVFVNLVYLTGRTYIYESKYDKALQFFQMLDEEYGRNGCFEYILAKRNGIGIINDQVIEEMLKSSTGKPEELDNIIGKIKQNIKLFSDLKNDDNFYKFDYSSVHDETYIKPSKDQRHVIECNKKLIKYYSLLIKLKDDSSKEKDELIKILQTIKDGNVFVDSDNTTSNSNMSVNFKNSLLISLGFALVVLPDDQTIERMIAEIVGFNKKGWCGYTYPEKNELIEKIFNKVLDISDYKKYARADAHDGLYALETLKDKKPLEVCPDKIARDEINELLNRNTKYGEVIISMENYDVQATGETVVSIEDL